MKLLIVESPAKGKTIEKYLGKDYKVMASYGHVRDLPKTKIGVDTEKGFKPDYVIPRKASKVIKELRQKIKKADDVYLATDYDREGEAIAWHVNELAGKSKDTKRITFTEITKTALQDAVKNPRKIDINLVDAQQARRVLDRLVGYKLSPFLWKKVFKGLSAGRVQSVAVRLIVDREREIKAFKPDKYWLLGAKLSHKSQEFDAYLKQIGDKKLAKLDINTQEMADKIAKEIEEKKYLVKDVESKEIYKNPSPAFTTSTLQQEAAHRLYFSAKQTMKLAQDLYEDGKITYMRTDSVNLSQSALSSIRKQIINEVGKQYLPEKARYYKTKSKGAQEAHEAIRPSHIEIMPEQIVGKKFEEKHRKLYDLIRRRTLACQMKAAILDSLKVDIGADEYLFRANGQKIKFDGYLKIWPTATKENILPNLSVGDNPDFIETINEAHETKPPARYSEAKLVKALEEHGIGRPSTYAPIISTIQARGYVFKDKGKFVPNESAFIVTDLLVENFPKIIDIEFTAGMEKQLDEIAEAKLSYQKMLTDFYGPFEKNLKEKEKTVKKVETDEKTDRKCPKCGKPIVKKMGKYGKFFACTGFPECRYTEQILNKTGFKCPDCKIGDIIERKTKRGKTFWGCSKFPKCRWASWDDPKKKAPMPTDKNKKVTRKFKKKKKK